MSQPIISVEGLGKCYRIQHQGQRQRYTALRDVIAEKAKSLFRSQKPAISSQATGLRPPASAPSAQEDFWALKDVSFEVKQGEVVGIIGRNGAGKSTLLKILSRITEPTKGRVTLRGRVASLLEVGTGFHPELTGRENVFLNGAILGMQKAEIKKKFDEIVAFAEVEKFLDTPVKRYSSGMYVRLAFAVAAHLEPEILIVDEVLAVGDAEFQKKCLGKMQDVAKGGRTVLFVSHNMSAIRLLSSDGLILERGNVRYAGNIDKAIAHYVSSWNMVAWDNDLKNIPRRGSGAISFTYFRATNLTSETGELSSGSDVKLIFGYRNNTGRPLSSVNVGFGVHGPYGERLFVVYASQLNQEFKVVNETGEFHCHIRRLPLNPGRYAIYPRLEVATEEADFPQGAVGTLDVAEGDFYFSGRPTTGKGECPFLVEAEWKAGG